MPCLLSQGGRAGFEGGLESTGAALDGGVVFAFVHEDVGLQFTDPADNLGVMQEVARVELTGEHFCRLGEGFGLSEVAQETMTMGKLEQDVGVKGWR